MSPLASSIALCGSALVGPESMLPITPHPQAALRISALCRSPVYGLFQDVLGQKLNFSSGPQLAYVASHLAWTQLLEPTVDLCADEVVRANVALSESFVYMTDATVFCPSYNEPRMQMSENFPADRLVACEILAVVRPLMSHPQDMEPFSALSNYIREGTRAARWSVSVALPAAGESTVRDVPPLVMAVSDQRVFAMKGVKVRARVYSFDGTCAQGALAPVLVGDAKNDTDDAGVAMLTLAVDTAGSSSHRRCSTSSRLLATGYVGDDASPIIFLQVMNNTVSYTFQ